MERDYPSHWEADVVLRDGATAHLRPIRPDDAELLVAFYARTSEESKYFRFFAPYPRLSEKDVRRFTTVDHRDRVALIALVGTEMIGVVRYDLLPDPGVPVAEVAFLIRDDHQGRGLGSVLLEHVAAAARERGIGRFLAEVLPANSRMISVFADAGYSQRREFEDGVVHLEFDLAPTENTLRVMRGREQRAEARSIARLLAPASVAVVGCDPGGPGLVVLRNLVAGGFTGRLYAIQPGAEPGKPLTGAAAVPVLPAISAVDGPVDLAVIAVPAEQVPAVVAECAAKGVHGLAVVSEGFAETGQAGRLRQAELVETARLHGMRVVGPNSFGIVNTDPAVSLNATVCPVAPAPGRAGLFAQSGAIGMALLAEAVRRGINLSTWVAAGNRADVSGNDLLQYWQDDAATDLVLLYLESVGNPRKFVRLARRLARVKPVVAVKSGGHTRAVPGGHAVRPLVIPDSGVDDLFAQAGIVRARTLNEMFDVAALLAYQPLPGGNTVAIVGNSDSLGLLAQDACLRARLRPLPPVDLGRSMTLQGLRAALATALADPAVDAVLTAFLPSWTVPDTAVTELVARLAADRDGAAKPLLTTFVTHSGSPNRLHRLEPVGEEGRPVPCFPTPEAAARALAHAVEYARWRTLPAGQTPELAGIEAGTARRLLAEAVPPAVAGEVELDQRTTARLLAAYGIHDLSDGRPVDPGRVATVVSVLEDPDLGPLVSFGLAGVATELLADRAWRALPLTDVGARDLVRSVRAAPLLFGHAGSRPVDVAALEELVLRVCRLADDLPRITAVELGPVLVEPVGCRVGGARIRVGPPPLRDPDSAPRALRRAG